MSYKCIDATFFNLIYIAIEESKQTYNVIIQYENIWLNDKIKNCFKNALLVYYKCY